MDHSILSICRFEDMSNPAKMLQHEVRHLKSECINASSPLNRVRDLGGALGKNSIFFAGFMHFSQHTKLDTAFTKLCAKVL